MSVVECDYDVSAFRISTYLDPIKDAHIGYLAKERPRELIAMGVDY